MKLRKQPLNWGCFLTIIKEMNMEQFLIGMFFMWLLYPIIGVLREASTEKIARMFLKPYEIDKSEIDENAPKAQIGFNVEN